MSELHDYYSILEVPTDAPQDEIHRAYRRAKDTYSPDSPAIYTVFSQEEARELCRLIDEAFAVLGNRSKRLEYDTLRKSMGPDGKIPVSIRPDIFDEAKSRTADPAAATRSPAMAMSATASAPAKLQNQTLPSGFARTVLSMYEVKQAFEAEISNQVSYDGPFLQKIRVYRNLNLDQISEYLRISKSYLMAIETNDYAALPAPVFTRGFIVQLAKIYGLDEKRAANSYMELFKKARPN